MQPIILIGPQGIGKTLHAQAIAKHFGCTRILDDEFQLTYPLPDNALVLANEFNPRWKYETTIYVKTKDDILALLSKTIDEVIAESGESKRMRHVEGQTMKSALEDWAITQHQPFTATDAAIKALKIPRSNLSREALTQISICLRHMGFKRTDLRKDGQIYRYWQRPETSAYRPSAQ